MRYGLTLNTLSTSTVWCFIGILFLLAGCSSTPLDQELEAYKQIPVEHEDAGYASASVVAVLPLAIAKTHLASNVSMTFTTALNMVQQYARAQEIAKMDSFQLGVSIGLSQRGLNSTQTTSNQDSSASNSSNSQSGTQTATLPISSTTTITDSTITATTNVNTRGQSVSNTDTRTVTRTQGVANSIPLIGGTPTTVTATDLSSRTVTINPTLAIQAADQLMKLTGMINQQFDAIPYDKDNESVYIVQIKTSLQPYKPLMPLDAYITLSMLPDLSGTDTTANMALLRNPPRLIPLAFGSEEYEFSSSGVSNNFLRGLSFGLTASAPGGAINVGAQKLLSSLVRTYATDVNGLIVTSPMSPNTIQVRLGAMWQGSAERAMIPRSFNGFFAVVVNNAGMKSVSATQTVTTVASTTLPSSTGTGTQTATSTPTVQISQQASTVVTSTMRLSLIAKPFFRDPKTGRTLLGTKPEEIIEKVKQEFCTFKLALKNDCVYNIGSETLATTTSTTTALNLHDDWFAFLNRIRRNDLEVLACVGMQTPELTKKTYAEGKTCFQNPNAAPLVEAKDWPSNVNKPVPGFVIEKFVNNLNRVAIKERSSYSMVIMQQYSTTAVPPPASQSKSK